MDTVYATTPIVLHPSDTRPIAFVFEDTLAAGQTLSAIVGSPTVAPSGGLALAGATINATEFNDKPQNRGKTVPIGMAVLATPSGQVAGNNYTVTIVATIASGGGNVTGVFDVRCEA